MTDSCLKNIIGDEECFEIIRKKLRVESMDKFRLVDYEIVQIGEVDGYMGQYFSLKTTVFCADEPNEKRVYNFFTKIPPPPLSIQYDWIETYGTFKKEVDLYTKVFPEVMENLEKNLIPECFFSREKNLIVLDDMTYSGYKMPDKSISFDIEHCQIVMRTLGKFHAGSIIFEESRKKNLGDEFFYCMSETMWPSSSGKSKLMFDAAVKGVVSLIDLAETLGLHERQELKKTLTLYTSDHIKNLRPSNKYRNVLCHGDLWANNVLFRYDANGKPEACCLIDFQLARYNPPAHDILCFLHFTTTREFRKTHSERLFKIYWDSLSESLSDRGLDAAVLFPWTEFIDSLKELRIICMAHGVLNIPIMLLEPTTANKQFSEEPDLLERITRSDRSPLICRQFSQVPYYRKRMLDALLELYENA